MSRSEVTAGTECIVGISRRDRTDIRFETVAAHHVNRAVEQAGYIRLQAHVIINRDAGFGIDVNHGAGVAVGAVVALARERNTATGVKPRSRKARSLSRKRSGWTRQLQIDTPPNRRLGWRSARFVLRAGGPT